MRRRKVRVHLESLFGLLDRLIVLVRVPEFYCDGIADDQRERLQLLRPEDLCFGLLVPSYITQEV